MTTHTRISYKKKQLPGQYISRYEYQHPSDGSRYTVHLDFSQKSYFIFNEVIGKTIKQGTVTSDTPFVLKNAAKLALKELGIVFQKDERLGKLKRSQLVNQEDIERDALEDTR